MEIYEYLAVLEFYMQENGLTDTTKLIGAVFKLFAANAP
jgi:hypothetical protein